MKYQAAFAGAVTAALLLTSGSALAQSNDIIGKQDLSSRNIWIQNSVPSGCRYTFTNAASTWTNSRANVRYVWSGYKTNYAYNYDASVNRNLSTASNTLDTQVEVGWMDGMANNLAEVHYRVRGTATNPYNLTDGDVIINNTKLNILWCNPSTAVPSNSVDMEYVMLHELGHVWGLGHDTVNTDAIVAPPKYYGPPSAKRALTSNDIGRATFLYGSKP